MTSLEQWSLAQAKIVSEIRELIRAGCDTSDIAGQFGWREADVWNTLVFADRGIARRVRRA